MDILIRPFQREDLDPLYFLDQRCTPPDARLSYERLLGTLLEKEVTAVVMVEDMDATRPPMLGSLIVRGDEARQALDLLALMIDPDFRRLGLARRLMNWAMHLGASKGLNELAAIEEDTQAALFLDALDFRRTNEVTPGFRRAEPRPRWTRPLGNEPNLAEGGAAKTDQASEAAGADRSRGEGGSDGGGGDGGDGNA